MSSSAAAVSSARFNRASALHRLVPSEILFEILLIEHRLILDLLFFSSSTQSAIAQYRNHSIFFRLALFCLGLDLGVWKPPNFADAICEQPLIRNRPALGSIVRSRKDPSMTKYQICPLDRWHIRVCSCVWPCCGWGTNKHSCSTWLCSHLLVIQTLSLKTARVYTNRNSSKNRARWKPWGAV